MIRPYLMARGGKEPKEMSDFSNAFLMADIAYHTHIRIVCTQTYTRNAALGPSKISARRNDNRLSDNESPLSPPLPSDVLKPTLCCSLSFSPRLFPGYVLSLDSDSFETINFYSSENKLFRGADAMRN